MSGVLGAGQRQEHIVERRPAQAEILDVLAWTWDLITGPVLDALGLSASPADGASPGNTAVIVADGRHIPWPSGTFDRVLADVPCSGLGSLRRSMPRSSITVCRVILMPVTLLILPYAISAAMPMSTTHVPATMRNAAHSQIPAATSPYA